MAPKKAAPSPPPVEEKPAPPPEPVAEQLDGDFIFQDGSTYSGQYLKVRDDVCLHGHGTLQTGPESFTGVFEKGAYKEGKFVSYSGAVYEGAFRDNLFHGKGDYTWPEVEGVRRAYRGTWKDGFMHGRGQFFNFSFGVDKCYTGFSIDGRFASNREEQDQMKKRFLAEYKTSHANSAIAAVKELAAKTTPESTPKDFFVQVQPPEGEEEKPEAIAEREAVLEIVTGPFPEPFVQQGAIQALAARLEPGAEKPLEPEVLEERFQRFSILGEARRLQRDQLQVVGQCVEFSIPDAEVGAIKALVLVNASQDYDIERAKWKVVHLEEAAAAS